MMDLYSDITTFKGVGEKSAALFRKLNITNGAKLLHYFPRDYEIFDAPVMIHDVTIAERVTIRAMLKGVGTSKKIRNLDILTLNIYDATGIMQLTFFNQPYLKKVLRPGQFYLFRGIPQKRPNGSLVMEQPRIYKEEEYYALQQCIQPRYSLTKGMTNHIITKVMKQVLSLCELPKEYLSEAIRERYDLLPLRDALSEIHFPENFDALIKARKRLAFNEFFNFILTMRRNKALVEKDENHYQMIETADTIRLLEALPYALTKAQQKVWEEIKGDLTSPYCMNRLIQGDVGSGKTILAIIALLMNACNGYQGAFMAPTEVLAVQHFENVEKLIKEYDLPLRPVLLVGSMSARDKKASYQALSSGDANVVIGTHAVIQDKVEFAKLSLVITDEQHRFGVKQREKLAGKGEHPHILVMSATPIPRTLAIILYGDLHLSIIDELPVGRQPIKNCVVTKEYRSKAYAFMEKEIGLGHQVYVICPMVEEGDNDELENVVEYTGKLRAVMSEKVRIAYLHGKMKPADKNRIMQEFSLGGIDILVSTTVIEVGINVPNATIMMVENAERFGLAQLHQLRGRVGRGKAQSYCIFMSSNDKEDTLKRLDILNHSNDGFHIANEDLKLRGPGDLFGIRQSGDFAFHVGDIYNDADVLKAADSCVEQLLEEDPELVFPEHAILKEQMESGLLNGVDFKTI